MQARSTLYLLLFLVACAPPDETARPAAEAPATEAGRAPAETAATAAPGPGETCVVGTLTDEGVECQALNTVGGDIYTLVGDLEGRSSGELVCACGEAVEMSTCMQGTTLQLTRIGSPALCP